MPSTILSFIRRLARRPGAAAGIALLTCAAQAGATSAQEFPQRPVKIVTPYAAGGASDAMTRQIAEHLSKLWQQSVVVENKPGASGTIAAESVARAAPDGYTMLMGTNALMLVPGLFGDKAAFDPIKSFEPVSLVGTIPFLFAAAPGTPVKNLADFVAMAKAEPGKYSYASFGTGSTGHLLMELFQDAAGIKLIHVPYKGEAPAITQAIGGHVQTLIISVPGSVSHVTAGKLIPLAVNGPTRARQLPDTPTFGESGYKGFEPMSWFGMMLPAKTPPAVVQKVNQSLKQILAEPGMNSRMADYGIMLNSSTPEALTVMMQHDIDTFTKVIREKNIKVD
ncbi:extra-cytoplasmic solute receptor family protein 186 (plasmid) [Achromobacter xylosoxidans A8]|uniref:Extra-cytoplasmic solute receptor family protein 186 n=1 Tax=Achromobacter xylosoxidans (strain A8) TaxID=762376 RepID=E3HY35_ACHXA|nr:tripartite tricarboxylate transporter substrate binding protein [Achromobacter xylosoxidans]ADP19989.1 extra-cytoplasmic solute receptor family protein 186 [Achromobacter xylosoxidans A8]